MNKKLLLIIVGLISFHIQTEELKIAVFSDGKIKLNGTEISIDQLHESFKKPETKILYYRDNPESEPHPNAMKVIQLFIDNKLPVTLSSTSDFSTYVDENGRIQKRKEMHN